MRNFPRITISIQLDEYDLSKDKTIVIPISAYLIRESMQPIDFPDSVPDGFTRMLCTNPNTISKTLKNRKEFANMIAKEVTELILAEFSSNDTKIGYKL